MCDDIPLIDVRDYLTSDRIKSKIIKLTPELIEKLKYILTSNLTKNQVLKYLNLSQTRFNDIVNLYTETIDKDYKEKLTETFYKNRARIITKTKIKPTLNLNSSNNLSKIKYEKGLSNNDIIKLSNNKITSSTISNICTGKINPETKTKCLLAEILNVSVKDIFPDDILFSKIKNYNDYLELNNWLRNNFIVYYTINKRNKSNYMKELSEMSKISYLRLYEFKNNHVNLNHNEMINLIKVILNNGRLSTNKLVPDLNKLEEDLKDE